MLLKQISFIFAILIVALLFICAIGSAAAIVKITDDSPSSITVHDFKDRDVLIKKPVERIVILDSHQQLTSALQAMGAYDKIIGVDEETAKEKSLFPNMDKLAVVGKNSEPDIEKIVELKPDLVLVGNVKDDLIKKLESSGLTVASILLFPTPQEGFKPTEENTRVLGSIVDVREKADQFVDWRNTYLQIIEERIKGLSENEKPKSLYTYKWKQNGLNSGGADNRFHYALQFAGATDINSDITGNFVEVDLEHVIKEDPSYIFIEEMNYKSGYGFTNTTPMKDTITSLSNVPGLSGVAAFKNNNVYVLPMSLLSGDTWLAVMYMAPVLHPELFKDFDSQKIHQEYIDKFMKVKTDVKKDGTFLYPQV